MPQNYTYTDLSAKDSVYMEIAGIRCAVTQFTSSWAANEIPTAVVMLPVGRDARTRKLATIHTDGKNIRQMEKVTVWFQPEGEFDRGARWPLGKVKIFEGFFTGLASRKVSGKISVVCNLIHWSAALSFSSSLTANGHVSNPADMNVAAVLRSLKTNGAGKGAYISTSVSHQLCIETVATDLWRGMKTIFCALANVKALASGREADVAGSGQFQKNDTALDALRRIEGPADDCTLAYKYGVPLKIQSEGVTTAEDAIANSIGNEFIENYSGMSFWDKLVGQFCPQFNLAFVPMVESAIVVADPPAYNGDVWKEIKADDYDSFDMSRELHRPLRAVAVLTNYVSPTGAAYAKNDDNAVPVVGGAYAEDSVRPGDGMIRYVDPPSWLKNLYAQPDSVGDTTGLKRQTPIKSATSPNIRDRTSTVGVNASKLYQRYAHTVFANEMLRGQTGSFSGKLRFDIAPLSILKLKATTEKFIGPGQDSLAFDIYGCVQRVTIAINAEAGFAGTTFTLSHVRNEAENRLPRTSVSEHPLFGKSIHGGGKHGSPLIGEYDIPPKAGLAPPPNNIA